MQKDTHFLSHLLPYSLESRKGRTLVLQSLKEYLFLLIAAKQALESFKLGKLTDFDALVGENACQIRAVKLALIVRENLLDTASLLDKILYSKKIVEEHINNNLAAFKKSSPSLKCIFEKDQIEVDLHYHGFFLLKAFLLTVVKEYDNSPTNKLLGNDFTNVKKIKSKYQIGTMFAEKLIKKLRQKISAASAQFIKNIANNANEISGENNESILHDYFIENNGLTYIPCYWNMHILINKILNDKIPIVLIIDQKAKDNDYKTIRREKFVFQTSLDGCQEIDEALLGTNQPVIVFQGISCKNAEEFVDIDIWKENILKNSPIDLILACSAAHPQYPEFISNHLLEKLQKEEKYKYYLEKAQYLGCELNNPSCFFLSHVFCDKPENIFQ